MPSHACGCIAGSNRRATLNTAEAHLGFWRRRPQAWPRRLQRQDEPPPSNEGLRCIVQPESGMIAVPDSCPQNWAKMVKLGDALPCNLQPAVSHEPLSNMLGNPRACGCLSCCITCVVIMSRSQRWAGSAPSANAFSWRPI